MIYYACTTRSCAPCRARRWAMPRPIVVVSKDGLVTIRAPPGVKSNGDVMTAEE